MYSFSNTMRESAPIFGIIMIVGGIFFCFFSYKYEIQTRFYTGIVITFYLALYVIMNHSQVQVNSGVFWSIVIVSFLIGMIVGWALSFSTKVVTPFLGLLLAILFTNLFYQIIVVTFKTVAQPAFWTIFILSISLSLYLSLKLPKFVFIISCAFLGSYCIIRVKF
jgi:hypothetical protein